MKKKKTNHVFGFISFLFYSLVLSCLPCLIVYGLGLVLLGPFKITYPFDYIVPLVPCAFLYLFIFYRLCDGERISPINPEYLNRRNRSLDNKETLLKAKEIELEKKQTDFEHLISNASVSFPHIAGMIADYYQAQDLSLSEYLRSKKPPAPKAADNVRQIAYEKRQLEYEKKMIEYKLNYIYHFHPEVEDCWEDDTGNKVEYVFQSDNDEARIRSVLSYLSDDEYNALSSVEKSDLALDRWKHRKKTNWEIGIDYERYIAYQYEKKGYKVTSFGALNGFDDMGRDVIAIKGDSHIIIQCKRWSTSKEVHENHIFQLYGTKTLYSLDNHCRASCVLVTTTSLSENAKKCANFLNVGIAENYPLLDYPLIKCNISNAGERIYHLPMDQQYDRVQINFSAGEFYTFTAKEAEAANFRRAKRWISD